MSEQVLADMAAKSGNRPLKILVQSKAKAWSIHLAISAVIFVALLALIVLVWYPSFYFHADGGWQGVRIIAVVDLVLGPFLTLVIFNPRKSLKEKIIDFTLIGLVQAAALTWGVYNVYTQRPLAMVHTNGVFNSVIPRHLHTQEIELDALDSLSRKRPAVLVAKATNIEDETKSMLLELNHELPRYTHFHLFHPLDSNLALIREQQLDMATIASLDKTLALDLDVFLRRTASQAGDYIFTVFTGRYQNVILALDNNGELAGHFETSLKAAELLPP